MDKKRNKFRILQQRFIDLLPQRIEEIEGGWRSVRTSGSESPDLEALTRNSHSLAGSSGTFHFFHFGEVARSLEALLHSYQDAENDSAELIDHIDDAIMQLREVAAEGPDQTSTETFPDQHTPRVSDEQPLVYLLEDDQTLATELADQIGHFGYTVEAFYNPETLESAVKARPPHAMLADIHMQSGPTAGADIIKKIHHCTDRDLPVIFISAYDSWQNRLNAVRAGGHAYLSKPLNVDQLTEQLDQVTGIRQEVEYRILIVEDTTLLAEHYAAVLESAGMEAKIVSDPSRLLEVLPEFIPDLVLMDLYMPECSGVEAAKVIRQHSGYTNLPIVYLSTEKGLEQQLEALRQGGDDFLQKPISDEHLLAAVKIRARRFRELSALMTRDSLTGLLNHINLKLSLERELSQARRNSTTLTFAMLDIDHFKSVNDLYGHPVGDRVIKSLSRILSHRLRKGDIAARYGGEEFAVILPNTSVSDSCRVLNELRIAFSEIGFTSGDADFNATFSAGIAESDPQQDMQSLITAADNALYQAKHNGRNRIESDGQQKAT
ncbi:hypothetical protein BOW53_07200 [Solemya pervernicosa gill symbiont]|uniref:diguanylate cyclase n=1 Tax=Solemya pervernicosa gill symbiont TaxID=642797 RepID=A0A1T2L670_9GAMM|nr:hypothetical protein BOW53_07200 [Solemya pervernicosa gill symbiont]